MSIESPNTNQKDPYADQEAEIVSFAKNRDISSDDLLTAYQIALGADSDDEEKQLREEVYTLAGIMKEYFDQGMPLNKVGSLIAEKEEFENAPDLYRQFVNNMDISENEKSVLHSIIEEKRAGLISIFDSDTNKIIASLTIPETNEGREISQSDLAMALLEKLRVFQSKNIEITFSE